MSNIREKLSLRTKVAFGIGSVGEIVFLGMFNTFINIYYNQAIGLSNSLIGVAIMLAMIGDAISDPVVGMISDRWRSRLGRRHPFLFAAPIPLAVSLFLIFNPPEILTGAPGGGEASQIGLFVWLAIWTILGRLFLTLYTIPHFALGGELTKDPHDRSQLFSANAIIGYAAGAMFAFTAWGFFLAGESVMASGEVIPKHLDASAYGPVVFTACAIMLVTISLCAMGTKHRVPYLSSPPEDQERLTLIGFYRGIISALKNPNYAFIMLGFFFLMISVGLKETFDVFVNTYFWELETSQMRWFGLAALPAIVFGALAAPNLMKKYDRKPVAICGLVALVVFVQLPIDLRLLGAMPGNDSSLLLPILLANTAAGAFSIALLAIAVLSMLGDISDENELKDGLRQEGLIYSARSFFAKASNSVGHFIAGISLDIFVSLPFEAVPGQVDESVIFRLGLLAGPVMSLGALIAIPLYARYRLTKKRHLEILDELEILHSSAQPDDLGARTEPS